MYIFLINFITCIYKLNNVFSALRLIEICDYSRKGQKPFSYLVQPLIACLLNPSLSNLGVYEQFVFLLGHSMQTFSSINPFPLIEQLEMGSLRKCPPFPNRKKTLHISPLFTKIR